MNRSHNPRILVGLLVGALLTAPLIAIFYAAWRLIGLPFVPYDVFDLMARVLPGRVITFGIDTMVTVIRRLNVGPTSVVAKAAEHAQAIGGFFISGCHSGRRSVRYLAHGGRASSISISVSRWVPFSASRSALISLHLSQTATTPPIVSGLWIVGVFLLWGMAFAWAYRRLASAGIAGAASTEPPATTTSAEGDR